MEIAVLGNENTVLAMRLAGIGKTVLAPGKREDLLEEFERLAGEKGIGLIITDNSCEKIRDCLANFVETRKTPLVIEVPGKGEKIENGIIEMITKKATGAK